MGRSLAAALLLFAFTDTAHADRVWLTNGNYLEGSAVVLPEGQVEIRSTLGALSLPAEQVARIERTETVEAEVERALAEMQPGEADTIYELAMWCESRGSHTLARRLLQETLLHDPEHAAAREALGYRRLEGRWVTDREWHELRGEVYFRGEWMRSEVRAQILHLEALEAKAEAERQRERAWLAQLRYEAELGRQAQSAATSGVPYLPWGSGSGIVVLPGGRIYAPPVPTPYSPLHPAAAPRRHAAAPLPSPGSPAQPPRHSRSSFTVPRR